MNFLTWNVCGAASKETCIHLNDVIKQVNPACFALLEPKVNGVRDDKIIARFRHWNCIRSEAIGRSGGISVFWKPQVVTLVPIIVHPQFIHCSVLQNGDEKCKVTFVYASPIASKRAVLWESLLTFSNSMTEAWFLMGDFNDISSMNDQRGGGTHYLNRCLKHKKLMDDCCIFDMGYSGHQFTWRRNNILVRLDKVYCNSQGRMKFPRASNLNLPFRKSDHCPILLRLEGSQSIVKDKPFRYLLAWETCPEFNEVVNKN
ncbi:hypothetical protein M5689_007135 [Euphorbia peplus]|nr:hypothetical protein M5689_007135 [Euphorbia peplus]